MHRTSQHTPDERGLALPFGAVVIILVVVVALIVIGTVGGLTGFNWPERAARGLHPAHVRQHPDTR